MNDHDQGKKTYGGNLAGTPEDGGREATKTRIKKCSQPCFPSLSVPSPPLASHQPDLPSQSFFSASLLDAWGRDAGEDNVDAIAGAMIHKGASQARGRRLVANARDATDPEVTRGKFGRSRTRLPRCRSRDERFAEANCGLRHVEAGSGRERSTKKGGWSRRGRRESIGLALSLSAALLRTEARAETEVTGEAGQEQKQVQQQGSPASPPPPSPPPSDSVAGLEAKVEVTSPTDKADAPAPTSSVNPSAITSEATAPPPSALSTPPSSTASPTCPLRPWLTPCIEPLLGCR